MRASVHVSQDHIRFVYREGDESLFAITNVERLGMFTQDAVDFLVLRIRDDPLGAEIGELDSTFPGPLRPASRNDMTTPLA